MMRIELKDLDKHGSLAIACSISDGYSTLYYNGNQNNCKLCTLDSVGNWLTTAKVENLKRVLRKSNKLICNVTLTNMTNVNFLKEYFKIVNIAEIPVGYGSGMQYHCCFLTGNTHYSGYDNYVARINKMQQPKIEKVIPVIPISNIDTIFEHLKHIDETSLQKIKSYKQPKRAKDLLKKILESK